MEFPFSIRKRLSWTSTMDRGYPTQSYQPFDFHSNIFPSFPRYFHTPSGSSRDIFATFDDDFPTISQPQPTFYPDQYDKPTYLYTYRPKRDTVHSGDNNITVRYPTGPATYSDPYADSRPTSSSGYQTHSSTHYDPYKQSPPSYNHPNPDLFDRPRICTLVVLNLSSWIMVTTIKMAAIYIDLFLILIRMTNLALPPPASLALFLTKASILVTMKKTTGINLKFLLLLSLIHTTNTYLRTAMALTNLSQPYILIRTKDPSYLYTPGAKLQTDTIHSGDNNQADRYPTQPASYSDKYDSGPTSSNGYQPQPYPFTPFDQRNQSPLAYNHPNPWTSGGKSRLAPKLPTTFPMQSRSPAPVNNINTGDNQTAGGNQRNGDVSIDYGDQQNGRVKIGYKIINVEGNYVLQKKKKKKHRRLRLFPRSKKPSSAPSAPPAPPATGLNGNTVVSNYNPPEVPYVNNYCCRYPIGGRPPKLEIQKEEKEEKDEKKEEEEDEEEEEEEKEEEEEEYAMSGTLENAMSRIRQDLDKEIMATKEKGGISPEHKIYIAGMRAGKDLQNLVGLLESYNL